MLSESFIILVEVMAAIDGNSLDAARFQLGARVIILIGTINALHHFRIDLGNVVQRIAALALAGNPEPARDGDDEIDFLGERQKRHLPHMHLHGLGQKIVAGGNDVGAEGIADQNDILDIPFLTVGLDDLRHVLGGLVGSLSVQK